MSLTNYTITITDTLIYRFNLDLGIRDNKYYNYVTQNVVPVITNPGNAHAAAPFAPLQRRSMKPALCLAAILSLHSVLACSLSLVLAWPALCDA